MIDQRILDISRRLMAAHLRERWGPMRNSITQRQLECSQTGHGRSGAVVEAISQICAGEVRAAVHFAWSNIWRTTLTVGIEPSDDLAEQLKAEVRSQTDQHFERLRAELAQNHRLAIGGSEVNVFENLISAREIVLAQIDGEVDLAVASLEQRQRASSQGGPVYQFYAPVAAVVSGANASASVVQNIGTQEKSDLGAALDALRAAIAIAAEVRDQSQKEDLIELVSEARQELDKPRPNALRLTSVLMGIGQAVQTIGSVDAAYQAVKVLAGAIGVPLP